MRSEKDIRDKLSDLMTDRNTCLVEECDMSVDYDTYTEAVVIRIPEGQSNLVGDILRILEPVFFKEDEKVLFVEKGTDYGWKSVWMTQLREKKEEEPDHETYKRNRRPY